MIFDKGTKPIKLRNDNLSTNGAVNESNPKPHTL